MNLTFDSIKSQAHVARSFNDLKININLKIKLGLIECCRYFRNN